MEIQVLVNLFYTIGTSFVLQLILLRPCCSAEEEVLSGTTFGTGTSCDRPVEWSHVELA